MAGRIQGITVEIGGDTTKLQTALKGVNTEIRNTQSQLRDVDKLLKLDPGNTELLAQKHRLLGDAVKETKEKLDTLKTAAEQAEQAFQWGTDFIGGIVNGIKSMIGKVGEAVSPVAYKIRSFLHFSVPDEGPLTDYESWISGHGDNEHRKHADVH